MGALSWPALAFHPSTLTAGYWGDLLGHIRHIALWSPPLPKAASLGQEKRKQPGKAGGNSTQCLTSDTPKVRNTTGQSMLVPSPSQLRPSNLLSNGRGVNSLTAPFLCSQQPSHDGFALTDKLLMLNCARTGGQPLDYPINPFPQRAFFFSQCTTDVPVPARTAPPQHPGLLLRLGPSMQAQSTPELQEHRYSICC